MLPVLHHLVAGFVRRTWLVVLVTILACSAFAARAVSAFTGTKLTEAPVVRDAVVASRPARPVPGRDKNGNVLVERNIFCSSCVPHIESGPMNRSSYSGEPAVLIATSVGAAPRATVRVVATEAQGSWGLGETIPRVGKIARIGNTAIDVVDEAGHTATLSLIDSSSTGGRPDSAAAATAKSPSSTAPASPFDGRIEKLGDMSYRVDRELVRELVMGTTQAKGVRALPVVKNGEIAGLRLAGVKPDSIAAAVGIKSNDIFDSIDGVKIKSAQQLLDLFTKLDSVSQVELAGTRAGKPLVLQMQLR